MGCAGAPHRRNDDETCPCCMAGSPHPPNPALLLRDGIRLAVGGAAPCAYRHLDRGELAQQQRSRVYRGRFSMAADSPYPCLARSMTATIPAGTACTAPAAA